MNEGVSVVALHLQAVATVACVLQLLRYYTVAALGVVFCGGYTTLDTVTGVLAKLMRTVVYCCLCPLDHGCPIKAVKP